jgi:hypothetical protein
LHKKYIQYGSLFSTPPTPTASWLWKGIKKCKQFLIAGSCLNISTSSFESIWSTAWVPSLPSYRPSPRSPNSKNLPPFSISDLILPGTRQWNEHLLYAIFDHFSADAISRLPISQAANPSYLWTPSLFGRFTSNSTYLAILNNDFTGTSLHSQSFFWKKIWKLQLTNRLRLFLWK